MTTLLAFIFVLGVLVFVHELGHFLVAKGARIRVEQFSLGFPPKAFGVQVGETEYCISWLPIGGYVKMAGVADFGTEEAKGEPWEFQSKPRWIQMLVMMAGPAMNFLLAFLIVFGVRLGLGDYVMDTTQIGRIAPSSPLNAVGILPEDRIQSVAGEQVADWDELVRALEVASGSTVALDVLRGGQLYQFRTSVPASVDSLGIEPYISSTVGSVLPGRPAEGAGLQPGDRIVAVDGGLVAQWWEMRERISVRPGQEIEIRWVRGGEEMAVMIVPRPERVGGETLGLIGIGPPMESMARRPVGIFTSAWRSGSDLIRHTTAIYGFIKDLVSGQVSGRALAGPVAIAQMAGQSAQQGWERLLGFMAMLSVNLAVLNLLPIPMLDGGHLMILSVESVARRSLSLRQKEVLQQVGFAFLIFVMIYVTFGDIGRIFGWFN